MFLLHLDRALFLFLVCSYQVWFLFVILMRVWKGCYAFETILPYLPLFTTDKCLFHNTGCCSRVFYSNREQFPFQVWSQNQSCKKWCFSLFTSLQRIRFFADHRHGNSADIHFLNFWSVVSMLWSTEWIAVFRLYLDLTWRSTLAKTPNFICEQRILWETVGYQMRESSSFDQTAH
jgi:hypothetical protein